MNPMLKGRLGLDDTRVPQKSRNGLVYVERARVAVESGSLVLIFDEAGETIELPYQRINALLLRPRHGHCVRRHRWHSHLHSPANL
jgi:CRISP-associated protein Cas1